MLAGAGKGDRVLSQITSKAYADPNAVELTNADFSSGSLRLTSYARPGKLFTANGSLMVGTVGVLKKDVLEKVVDAVVKLLKT